MLEKSLKLFSNHYGEEHHECASSLENLGMVYSNSGEYEKAKEYYEKCLKIQNKHYGEYHYNNASCLGNLGNLHKSLGNL